MRHPDRRHEEHHAGRRLGEGRTRIGAWRTAVLAGVSISLIAIACGETPPTRAPESPVTRATPRATATASADPAPGWAVDLLGQLDCRAEPAPGGYERGSAPPVGHEGTASPYGWLYAIDDPDLPLAGYVIEPVTRWEDGLSHFTRHVYRKGGATKAVLLMEGTSTQGGRGSWDVTGWSACRPDEFDPADGRTTDDAPWLDAAGRATDKVHTIAGPAHCGYQSTVWFHRRGNLYLRDPDGVLASKVVRPYAEPPSLPRTAVDTGFHSVRWRLFETRNRDVAWMVRPDGGVEAWPRSVDLGLGCA